MSKEVYPEWYIDVKSICPNRDTQNFLDFMNLKLEDCKWKNITSIGWGLGVFEMDAAKQWAIMTAVDPIFSDKSLLDWKIQENIHWLNKKTNRESSNLVERLRMEVAETLASSRYPDKYEEVLDRLRRYDERKLEIDEYIRRRREQIEHLKNWGSNQEKYWLILNPSSWDNIVWIENNSQDVVVIAHTLSHIYNKSSWNIIDFLEEAFRILDLDWKLYIIDYVWDIKNLEKILKKTELKEYYKVNKGSFVCCFDKKWLGKFLENELK